MGMAAINLGRSGEWDTMLYPKQLVDPDGLLGNFPLGLSAKPWKSALKQMIERVVPKALEQS